jgi:uncharacterized protein YaiI (UPF0178 family)
MHIWVDADACPGPIKEILFRAADRRGIHLTLVANHFLRVPKSPFIRSLTVESGFDVADGRIASSVQPGDLVITGDIPLASQVVEAGCAALNPRGTFYTAENIRQHLARRNFMEELRSTGTVTGGPSALDRTHLQTFANALDRYLTRQAGAAPHGRTHSDGDSGGDNGPSQ